MLTGAELQRQIENQLENEGFSRNTTIAQYFHLLEAAPAPLAQEPTIADLIKQNMSKPFVFQYQPNSNVTASGSDVDLYEDNLIARADPNKTLTHKS